MLKVLCSVVMGLNHIVLFSIKKKVKKYLERFEMWLWRRLERVNTYKIINNDVLIKKLITMY